MNTKEGGVEFVLFLCDIRSAHNVGSLLRSASFFGVSRVFLGGVTPAPCDRFGRVNQKVCKVSLGAENEVLWESKKDIIPALHSLKQEGYLMLSLEQSKKAQDIRGFKLGSKAVLVVGEETKGLTEEILSISDEVLEIKKFGIKESLNVSTAGAIALYTLRPRK